MAKTRTDSVDFMKGLNLEIELLLRKRLSEEEYLLVMSNIEGIINTYRKEQDSSNFINLISHMREKNKNDFMTEYMGNFEVKCSVTNHTGIHCPNEPKHFFEHNGKEVGLCDQCYKNYNRGYYDYKYQSKKPMPHRLSIK